MDWMDQVKPNVKTNKAKKPGRAKRLFTWYKDGKSVGHTTIGGVGLVGRLMGQGRKSKKSRKRRRP